MLRTILVFLTLLGFNSINAAGYDVLIRNGTVYDGTGVPAHLREYSAVAEQGGGRLIPGVYADLTLFDPNKIQDHATFADSHKYTTEVEYVLVNGVPVVSAGKHTAATPGRAVRGPGWVQE